MKLDFDCIREILLAVESQTGYQEYTSAYAVVEAIDKFTSDVVMYHINQCELYGFFTEVRHYQNGDDDSTIIDLSPKGHEFIRNIRSENTWNSIKKVIAKMGTVSVSMLAKIAEKYIMSILPF
ncbi:MAG: DUF2513 domain-containing protein [Ruminococcus sp.]|nr:DUF2513 domain-containing protein [Ruminococcus sp.]